MIIFTICPTPFPLFRWKYSYILFSLLLNPSVILCYLSLCIVPRSFCLSSLAVHFCVCMHDFSFSLICVLFSCPKNPLSSLSLFFRKDSWRSIRSISGLAGLRVLACLFILFVYMFVDENMTVVLGLLIYVMLLIAEYNCKHKCYINKHTNQIKQ